ncbi:uncharacterized protein LOC123310082 [Coccinella septempunctata]|uniref:uncharacterized protein LOC123310082 n=1 Tax=Coccinella septempunctata TaxID=41139 RepID=UPI001D08F043|nr:uncharacterized protein LOC123310082 [Coccinella septempunctata]
MGFTYIFEYLRRLELPTIPRLIFNGSNGNEKFDWTRTEVKLKRIMGLQTFISFNILPNPHNNSENVMYMSVPRTQCRRRSLRKHHDDISKKIIKYVVQEIIRNITSEIIPESMMADAFFIIRNITGFLCQTRNKSSPKESDLLPYKFEDLQEEIDRHMSGKINHTEPEFLHSYVGHIFDGIEDVDIDFQQDLLYIKDSTKSFILDIITYIYSLPEAYVEFYLWWDVVKRLISYTYLNEFVRRIENPHGRIRINALSGRALELPCSKEVTSFMQYAVTYGIAQRWFKTSTGQQVKIMVKQMRDELRNNIETADWLDEKTRTANLEKLKSMNSFIGIPDWLFVDGELAKYYRKVGGEVCESYS